MAEELALHELARDGGHVQGDERPVPALAVVVQRPRHQFLARAGLAIDHDRQIRAHEARQHAVDLLHRGRAADERKLLFLLCLAALRITDRILSMAGRQGTIYDAQQLRQVERLGKVFEGAALGRLDGGQQGRLRRHDDDPQLRPDAADPRDQVEPVLVRHHHVGDHQIAIAVLHPLPQGGGVAGRAHAVTPAPQRLGQDRANGAVVVGDQDRRVTHRMNSPRRPPWVAQHGKPCAGAGYPSRSCRHGRR